MKLVAKNIEHIIQKYWSKNDLEILKKLKENPEFLQP